MKFFYRQFILLSSLSLVPFLAQSRITFNAIPLAPCAPGGVNVAAGGGTCATVSEGDESGKALWGANSRFGASPDVSWASIGIYNVYPAFSGYWQARNYLCPSSVAAKCQIKNSSTFVDSLKKVYLRSTSTFADQNPYFGGAAPRIIPYSFSICTTMVDESGIAWSSTDPTSCSDGNSLPAKPAACYLNYNNDLDVQLGTLERENIAKQPQTTPTTKKSISVLCTRDAGTTVKMQFQYTPLNIDGQSLVKSSTDGLGVAIIYNGKVMSLLDEVTLNYSVGYSNLDLEFEAVRDPKIKLEDIKTGAFTANAVMIMTEQ